MFRAASFASTILVIVVVAACAEDPLAPTTPDEPADLSGRVLSVTDADLRVLEREPDGSFPDSQDCTNESIIGLSKAEIWVLSGDEGPWRRGSIEDLRPGQIVIAWVGLTERRSCPRQLTGEVIHVL